MAEENNKTIVLALVAAIVISLGGTFLTLNKLDKVGDYPIFTGFATNDTGFVNVTIQSLLSIDVNDTESFIDFGVCNAPDTPMTTSISSNYTQGVMNASSSGPGDINCTEGNLNESAKYIRILNLGNTEANITINTTHDGPDLLTSANAKIWYNAANFGSGDCMQARATGWNELISNNTEYNVCERLGYLGGPSLSVYINLTIPFDASTGGLARQTILTFAATQSI